MSIKTTAAEINRAKQQARIDEKHQREAEARPEPMHRAVHFLLQQAIQHDRDCTKEAEFHLKTLDEAFGQKEQIAQLERQAEESPVETAEQATPTNETPETEKKPEENPVTRSRRFTQGRTGAA